MNPQRSKNQIKMMKTSCTSFQFKYLMVQTSAGTLVLNISDPIIVESLFVMFCCSSDRIKMIKDCCLPFLLNIGTMFSIDGTLIQIGAKLYAL